MCQPAPNKPSSIPIILYFQNAASLNFGSPVTAQKPNIGSILFMSAERAGPVCIFCALPNNSHGILEIRPLAHQAKLSCLDRTQTFVFLPNCAARCSENTSRTLFAAYLCPPLLNTPTIVAYAGRGRGDHIYGYGLDNVRRM